MSGDIDVRLVHDGAERETAYRIRAIVFVGEQAVAPELERDAADETAEHFLAYVDHAAVGTGRLVVAGATGILGRVAVLATARGRGAGAALVRAIEDRGLERGLAGIELHAQAHARRFYEALGYVAYGSEYLEAGIVHISMHKQLQPGGTPSRDTPRRPAPSR